MKKWVWKLILLLEIGVILRLGQVIYKKRFNKNILGAISVSPLKKENVIFSKNGELKYFYEPTPDTIDIQSPSWLGYTVKNTINADGLNERYDYTSLKPPRTFRILTLGDSFTLGAWVNTSENYPEQLEDRLNSNLKCTNLDKFEVINFGYGGYDIEFAMQRFSLRGQKYHPDLIFWFIKDDDFEQYAEAVVEKVIENENALLASGVKDTTYVNGEYYPSWTKANMEVEKEYGKDQIVMHQYQKLAELTQLYAGSLVLFTFDNTVQRHKQLMQTIANRRSNIYFFDRVTSVDVLPDYHPSSKGHSQIAEALYGYLVKNKIIPCD